MPATTLTTRPGCLCRAWVGPLAERGTRYTYTADMCDTHRAAHLAACDARDAAYEVPRIAPMDLGTDAANEKRDYHFTH